MLFAGAAEVTPSKLRSAAEKAFVAGDYNKAIGFYSKCIKLEPSNIQNYYKRFRVYSKMQKYSQALSDLDSALELDPKFSQALGRRAKLNLQLGNFETAIKDANDLIKVDKDSSIAKSVITDSNTCIELVKQAENLFQNNIFDQAKDIYNKLLEIATYNTNYRHKKCECLLRQGDYYSILNEASILLKYDKDDLYALNIRGDAHFNLGEYEMATRHYRQCLLSDPEYKKCKEAMKLVKSFTKNLEKVEQAINNQQYNEGIESINKLLNLKITSNENVKKIVKLQCKLYSKMKNKKQTMEYCEKAISLDSKDIDSAILIGDLYMEEENYEEAVRAYKRAQDMDNENQQAREKVQKAETALKQSKQKNYYKILGVSRTASQKEIKKAYRKKALENHPDKVSEDKKEAAVKRFQDIGEAYEVLSNPESRGKYDRGEDPLHEQQQPQQGSPFTFHFGGGQGFNFGQGGNFHFKFG